MYEEHFNTYKMLSRYILYKYYKKQILKLQKL